MVLTHGVEAVALEEEADDAHADTRDRRSDENEQSEHDDAFGIERGDAVHDCAETDEMRWFGDEVRVVGARAAVVG